jgi:hypothetical protein
MMKLTLGLSCAMLLAYVPASQAQHVEDKVREAIEASIQGKCSDVLSTMIKATCEGQLAQMSAVYSRLGALDSLEFKGLEATPSGQAEVYQAIHANGKMLWLVIKAPDGRLSTFWSPGPQ